MARLLRYVVNAFTDTLLADDYVPLGVQMTNAPVLWARGFTGKNVIVAVIDSGADYNHPDFRRKFYAPINLSGSRATRDENGHGTHVTGTIAANGWLRGVAPDCRILPIKVFGADGSGSDAAIIRAFHAAADWVGPSGERVNIINASFGGSTDSPGLHDAVKYAVGHGIIVPTAAGNEGDSDPTDREYAYPGAYDEVVEVASVNEHGVHSEFSNVNEEIDVCGLGEQVESTYPTYMGHRYAILSGTSMATPHEAGICAIAYDMFISINGRRPHNEDELWHFVARNVKPLRIPKMEQGLGLGYLHPELLAATPTQDADSVEDGSAAEAADEEPSKSAPLRGLPGQLMPPAHYVMQVRAIRRGAYIVQVGGVCKRRLDAAALAHGIRRRLESANATIKRVGF